MSAIGTKEIPRPFANDSGKKTGYRRIRAGRSGPRTALYLAAMRTV